VGSKCLESSHGEGARKVGGNILTVTKVVLPTIISSKGIVAGITSDMGPNKGKNTIVEQVEGMSTNVEEEHVVSLPKLMDNVGSHANVSKDWSMIQ
jgi:hypothetical protein